MEIFTFLYYANEESDDIIGGSTKTVQHSITNISRNISVVLNASLDFVSGNIEILGKQNSLFPSGPVIKC